MRFQLNLDSVKPKTRYKVGINFELAAENFSGCMYRRNFQRTLCGRTPWQLWTVHHIHLAKCWAITILTTGILNGSDKNEYKIEKKWYWMGYTCSIIIQRIGQFAMKIFRLLCYLNCLYSSFNLDKLMSNFIRHAGRIFAICSNCCSDFIVRLTMVAVVATWSSCYSVLSRSLRPLSSSLSKVPTE